MSGAASAMFWLLVLLCLVIAAFFGVMWIRKSLRESSQTGATEVFTLSDLRRLRATEQISEEEYERLKAQVIATAKTPTKPAPPPKQPPRSQED